jgi:predicted alpha/beta hydrolase
MMQAASDIFLGWVDSDGVDYYLRQLRDMKGTVDTSTLTPAGFVEYARICGWALARAHARSGMAGRIAGYAGTGDTLDEAISRFALAYADQTERDHALLVEAVRSGRVKATPGV